MSYMVGSEVGLRLRSTPQATMMLPCIRVGTYLLHLTTLITDLVIAPGSTHNALCKHSHHVFAHLNSVMTM